nr:hypothetical protein PJ912_05765 [Pectobacterium colocasium]
MTKISASVMPIPGVGDFERKQRANQTIRCIQRRQGNPRDRCGQREGHVDHGIDHFTAGKGIAHEHPGQQRPENTVNKSRSQRCTKRKPQGEKHLTAGYQIPKLAER